MIEIIDNFIEPYHFSALRNAVLNMPWYFGPIGILNDPEETILCDTLDNYHFIHLFYKDYEVVSEKFNLITPIIDKLKIRSLIKIKSNLTTRTSKIVHHTFHRDVPYDDSFTSVYYINTNDGYTMFEDGTKVESVENRMVIFPSHMIHTGTTCTNDKVRIVINFNYF
jgi:hypothetical protein